MHFNMYDVFYSQYSQQHVSASIQISTPHRRHTSPIIWTKAQHITVLVVTLQTLNSFNSQLRNYYPFLTCIYIT